MKTVSEFVRGLKNGYTPFKTYVAVVFLIAGALILFHVTTERCSAASKSPVFEFKTPVTVEFFRR